MAISSVAQMLILLYNKQIYWRAESWNRCDGAKHSAPLELLQLDAATLAKSFIGSEERGTIQGRMRLNEEKMCFLFKEDNSRRLIIRTHLYFLISKWYDLKVLRFCTDSRSVYK